MTYYPPNASSQLHTALIWLYIATGFMVVIVLLTYLNSIYPESGKNLVKFFRRLFEIDVVTQTVYSDKTKNYSQTEFLPIPSKAPTNSFSYEFLGWDKFAKDEKGNFCTKPIFLKKVKTYVVNVYDDNQNLLETHEVQYGAGVTLENKIINKSSTKEFEYEFVGWNKDLKTIFENTEVYPMFKAKPIKYSYKFLMNDEKTVVFEKESIYGTPIVCPADPVLIDDEFVYEFVGWKGYKRNMVLDQNYIFVAVFEKKNLVSDVEKQQKQENAIKVALNDYKKPTKKVSESKTQDSETFKKATRIKVEKNEKTKIEKKVESEPKEPKKKLFDGVIVEKNKKS